MGQADELQRRVRALIQQALLVAGKHAFDRKVNVVEAAHPREQRVALKNNGSIRPRSTYSALSQHQHALRRLQQTRNQIQQRRRPQPECRSNELAARDRQVDVTHDGKRPRLPRARQRLQKSFVVAADLVRFDRVVIHRRRSTRIFEVARNTDQAASTKTHYADHEDRDDDVPDVKVVPLVPYPEADAYAAGQHLGGNDHSHAIPIDNRTPVSMYGSTAGSRMRVSTFHSDKSSTLATFR